MFVKELWYCVIVPDVGYIAAETKTKHFVFETLKYCILVYPYSFYGRRDPLILVLSEIYVSFGSQPRTREYCKYSRVHRSSFHLLCFPFLSAIPDRFKSERNAWPASVFDDGMLAPKALSAKPPANVWSEPVFHTRWTHGTTHYAPARKETILSNLKHCFGNAG